MAFPPDLNRTYFKEESLDPNAESNAKIDLMKRKISYPQSQSKQPAPILGDDSWTPLSSRALGRYRKTLGSVHDAYRLPTYFRGEDPHLDMEDRKFMNKNDVERPVSKQEMLDRISLAANGDGTSFKATQTGKANAAGDLASLNPPPNYPPKKV